MTTLTKALRRLTKVGLQIPHAGEGSQEKGEGVQAQPGSGAMDNLPRKRIEPVLGDTAHGENEGTRTKGRLPRKQVPQDNEEICTPSQREGDKWVPRQSGSRSQGIARPDVDQSVENPGISHSDILILIPDSGAVYDLIFTLFILLTLSR